MGLGCIIVIIILAIILIGGCILLGCYNNGNLMNMNSFNMMNPFRNCNNNQPKNNFVSDPTNELMRQALGMKIGESTIPGPIAHQDYSLDNKVASLQGKQLTRDQYDKIINKTIADPRRLAAAANSKLVAAANSKLVAAAKADPRIAADPRVAAAVAAATGTTTTGLANTGTFNSLYGNSSGSPFNANLGTSTYGTISDGNSMTIPVQKIAAAEQELWMANYLSAGQVSLDNLDLAGLSLLAQPTIDYESYLDNLVIDDRLLNNHSNWVNEMLPWSGTAQMVDNIDEAMSNSLPFVGLRRPQAIAQDPNALFQTELDASYIISNPKFVFNS